MIAGRLSAATALRIIESHISRGNVDFLTGAGVSMKAPSLLPSGMELKERVVSQALANLSDRDVVSFLLSHPAFKAVQPEVLFSDIYMIARKFVFLAIRNEITGTYPNSTHSAIGRLTRDGRATIFTTNFDELLELAGATEECVKHLHGSAARPQSIGTLISDIARIEGIGEQHTGRALLVTAGYSASDPDVMKFLRQSRYRTIIWLTREGSDESLEVRVTRSQLPSPVYFCATDIHAFFEAISPGHGDVRRPRRRSARPTAPTYDRAILIAALILYHCEQYPKCVQLIDGYLLSSAIKRRTAIVRAEIFRAEAGRPAGVRAEESLARLRSLGQIPRGLRVDFENIIGVLLLDVGNFALARKHLERVIAYPTGDSLPMLHRNRLARMWCVVTNNLGLCHFELKDFNEARKYFLVSIRKKLRLGNPIGLISGFNNLVLVHTAEGRSGRAKFWKNKAEELVFRYGAFRRRIELLKDLHDLLNNMGFMEEGRSRLAQARQILREHLPHLTTLDEELCAREAPLK